MSLAARKIRLIMHLRRLGITDTAVLAAIEQIPREIFVPQPFHDQAYEDRTLPIGHGQTLSQPHIVARMTQALAVQKRHKVLEIGTGSGYQTAILSRLSRRVYTIERHRSLSREAEERFSALRLHNTVTKVGDGSRGWKEQAPFDRIIITAAAEEVPSILYDQLAVGGLMVLPLGPDRGDQELFRIVRTEDGQRREKLGNVRFVPLISGAVPKDEDKARPAGSAGPGGSDLA